MRVVALAGGVGGAKLAHGLQAVVPPGDLSVVVNTGDDLELFGLLVSPDVDTVLYTLAGLANPDTGWGIAGDTWTALDMLGRYGEPTWFRIGDADLATHVRRTGLLRAGATLTQATADMAAALGVRAALLPMSDDRVRTRLETDAGSLDFQTYFVARGQRDEVRGVVLDGIDTARPSRAVLEALAAADLIVVAPSNPIVSVGPILALPGIREAISAASVPRIAVTPIVAGRALRGPADRMLSSLGHEPTALGVARLYAGLIDVFVLDEVDRDLVPAVQALGMRAIAGPTVMTTDASRAEFAAWLLANVGR
ncbi:MAG: 2-phospho-L-lactate transferase [Chloroflexota bacterium]|nr:2-phospho-L-lactate transferase [Chloroflexota bacterium]